MGGMGKVVLMIRGEASRGHQKADRTVGEDFYRANQERKRKAI